MSDAALKMDAIYRVQRHFYDLTRKPYLLGRDVLIRELNVPTGGTVLEIGCGTARNLLHIARAYPHARCFGLDVSEHMLETARASVERAGAGDQIRLALADATMVDPKSLFGVGQFDRIVISYAISMIPEWPRVIAAVAPLLCAGGSLHIVDFGTQDRLPNWFRAGLRLWLAQFSVTPRDDLREQMARIAQDFGLQAHFREIYRGYTALAELRAV